MVNAKIIVEGGGKTDDLQKRCRAAFHSLLDGLCGNSRPRIVAKGSRDDVFDSFKLALNDKNLNFVAMLIDSEDSLADINKTWSHLKKRDSWTKPKGASDDQVLFMTTSMETWILAGHLSLPANAALELLDRTEAFSRLEKHFPTGYKKGKQSFQLLAKVDPEKLENLPSFARVRRILKEKLTS